MKNKTIRAKMIEKIIKALGYKIIEIGHDNNPPEIIYKITIK